MKNAENEITVLFTNVPDPKALKEAISSAIQYPIVFEKEQNNGIIAYVLQGVLPHISNKLFRECLENSGLGDVDVETYSGNIFER